MCWALGGESVLQEPWIVRRKRLEDVLERPQAGWKCTRQYPKGLRLRSRIVRVDGACYDAGPMPEAPLILVVDDVPDARHMYSSYLKHHGFRVVEATNGVEAVEQAYSHQPSLVLMDLGMPHLDGWEATRRIKADERTRRIPVLAVSGHAFPDAIERAKAAGVHTLLAKPAPPPIVLATSREMLAAAS
jgi:two-component system, cell cycle response regulator DivK